MLCRDDIVQVRDVNVCTDVLCVRVFAEFQKLGVGVNETIGENFMFSDILDDFETVLVHKSLNVPMVNSHRERNAVSDFGFYYESLKRELKTKTYIWMSVR